MARYVYTAQKPPNGSRWTDMTPSSESCSTTLETCRCMKGGKQAFAPSCTSCQMRLSAAWRIYLTNTGIQMRKQNKAHHSEMRFIERLNLTSKSLDRRFLALYYCPSQEVHFKLDLMENAASMSHPQQNLPLESCYLKAARLAALESSARSPVFDQFKITFVFK